MKSLDDLKELGRFEINFLDEDNAVCCQKISDTKEYKSIKKDLLLLEAILNNIQSEPTITREFDGTTTIKFIISKTTSMSNPCEDEEFNTLFTALQKKFNNSSIDINVKREQYLEMLDFHAKAGKEGKEEARYRIMEEILKFEDDMRNNYGLIWDHNIMNFRKKDKEANNESF